MPSSSSAGRAFGDGWRRVVSAPALIAGVWLATVAAAVPFGLAVRDSIASHLGASAEAETQAHGVNLAWWDEFGAEADGLAATFDPVIIGFGGTLANLSALVDNDGPRGATLAVAAGLALWLFLAGGLIDRYARQRRLGTSAFFATCGVFFFRFLRLGAIALAAYWVLFGFVHGWLFQRFYPWITRDLSVERTAFVWRALLYGVFLLLVAAVNLVVDFARVRAVVEDRRSMIGALGAGLRFVRRHLGGVVGLYLLNTLVFAVVLAGYAFLAPGATWPLWSVVLATQAYVVARLAVKFAFYATATSYFQAHLAHAQYAAAPVPVWPDSPAAEAITNSKEGRAGSQEGPTQP